MYPEEVRIFIDGRDVTSWIFGESTINPNDAKFSWQNIDITSFVRSRGTHTIEITAESGQGRVEAIVVIR